MRLAGLGARRVALHGAFASAVVVTSIALVGVSHAEPPRDRRVSIELPTRASDAFLLRDRASGLSVSVRPRDAASVLGRVSSLGEIEMRAAIAVNGDVANRKDSWLRSRSNGLEDFVDLGDLDAAEIVYDVTLGEGVAGLRWIEGVLELLDSGGAPRLRMEPPYVQIASAPEASPSRRVERQRVEVAVMGCAVDQDASAPWGRAVTPPGSRTCGLHLTWHRGTGSPGRAILDPAWTSTDSLAEGRGGHTTTRLQNGRFLVAGGLGTLASGQSSAEIFDPASETFAMTGSMLNGRGRHAAALLSSGRVVVMGGTNADQFMPMASAEIYDPTLGTWSSAMPLSVARFDCSATYLPTENKVLVTGGDPHDSTVLAAAELFDPNSKTFTPTPTPQLYNHRAPSSATLLVPDRVLVVGTGDPSNPLGFTEIYDGSTGQWADAGGATKRNDWTATKLSNGKVLFSGTCAPPGCTPQSMQQYDPGQASFVAGPSNTNAKLFGHRATLLDTGVVLLSGGLDPLSGQVVSSTYSVSGVILSQGSGMLSPRSLHSLDALPGGRAIAIGGFATLSNPLMGLQAAEIFGPAPLGSSCSGNDECGSGFCGSGTCCTSACEGTCMSCLGAETGLTNGTCGPIVAGMDPHMECPDMGSPGCVYPVNCDGAGACQVVTVKSCLGQICAQDSECDSGFCTDGVCCASRCDGACLQCDQGDAAGMCLPIPKFGFDVTCKAADPGTICGAPGFCDGEGACANFLEGEGCGVARCQDNTPIKRVCVGPASCQDKPLSSCEGFVCLTENDGTCTVNCNHDDDCTEGAYCFRTSDPENGENRGTCLIGKPVLCLDDHTAQTIDGSKQTCGLSRCRDNACVQGCQSSADCVSGARCDAESTCVIPEKDRGSDLDSCHCETPRSRGGGQSRGLVLAALAVAWLARRRTR